MWSSESDFLQALRSWASHFTFELCRKESSSCPLAPKGLSESLVRCAEASHFSTMVLGLVAITLRPSPGHSCCLRHQASPAHLHPLESSLPAPVELVAGSPDEPSWHPDAAVG